MQKRKRQNKGPGDGRQQRPWKKINKRNAAGRGPTQEKTAGNIKKKPDPDQDTLSVIASKQKSRQQR
jgi:hypothetical protein